MKSSFIAFLLLVGTSAHAAAQADNGIALERGRTFQFQSSALGGKRTIDISLPAGYATDSLQHYPVVFVLDGGYEQEMAAAITRFYADANKLPPMIVVGIRHPDRFHELTTPLAPGVAPTADAPNPGGAEKFLAFLGNELIPWVQRSYRADSTRVLVGHSLGGLFALYAIAQRPELFTGWILMEPSAWWNNGKELREAKAMLSSPAGRHERVMAVDMQPLGLDTTSWGGNTAMVRELSIKGETHTSMAAVGYAQALSRMFADLQPAEWKPGMRPIAMLTRYDSLAFRLGYPVPIPEFAFETVARMSIDARYYDDAAKVLDRMERTLGESADSRDLRAKLQHDRAAQSPGFVQLDFPAKRPTPTQAKAFLGHWKADGDSPHEIDVRASGETIELYERDRLGNNMHVEGNRPVVQVTSDGVLEWGQDVFRGLAALLVLRGAIQPDGSMLVTREVRGWVTMGPTPAMFTKREVFRKAP